MKVQHLDELQLLEFWDSFKVFVESIKGNEINGNFRIASECTSSAQANLQHFS
jgi:hypothetical protein